MPQKKMKRAKSTGAVTLKSVAAHVGLTAGTVSAVLNDSAAAKSIPEATKARILAAARELDYRPNFFARTLRNKRTYTIGVIAEEIGDAYGSMVISGVERYLRSRNYFFLTVIHRHDPALISKYSQMLVERGVEGFIAVDTLLERPLGLPTVAVAGHRKLEGVTNIVLDHMHAARLALQHLVDLGHHHIGFLRGQKFSSDAKDRWEAILATCSELGITVDPNAVVEMDRDDASPEMGYDFTKQLMAKGSGITAIFAYNDIAAVGAIRALRELGHRVPDDISVVGFDDIRDAAFHNPSLTTVRQPLGKMGEIAAQTLLDRIEGAAFTPEIAIEPLLVIRESTGRAAAAGSRK
jgi:LacI family transcriptional regulator